ncbi:MAG TPA: hypothetical protein VN366_08575 [Feifaniaceae bacterium]|nr:hypothetical protein [Feifaniaceae bacterium]
MQHALPVNLLCVVCDLGKVHKVTDILDKHDSLFTLIVHGKGTASTKTLNYLGLGETGKAVFIKVLPTDKAHKLMDTLDTALLLEKPGNGIAFIAKIDEVCFHRHIELASETNGGITMQQNSPYHLIFVVLNRGYSEEVMEAARAAGATGGTALHAHGYGAASMEKFFGTTIAPEKELLMIVTQDAISGAVMDSIAEKAGLKTDACAVSFSLPIDAVKGIRTAKGE